MKKRVFIIILIGILLISPISAFVISPGRIELNYQPNDYSEFSYQIGGYKLEEPLQVTMNSSGDLAEHIEIYNTSTIINPGEWKTFYGRIFMPPDLKPGFYDSGVTVLESATPGSSVGARGGAVLQIWLRIPYPGKYLELRLVTDKGQEIGEPIKFYVQGASRGKEIINNLNVNLHILSSDEKIDSITGNLGPIYPEQEFNYELIWDYKGKITGEYTAKANINYDGNTEELTTNFKIGDLLIKIIDIYGERMVKGEISKLTVSLESRWNQKIEDIFAELKVYNGEIELTSKSETFSLNPWVQKNITIFFDATTLNVGEYDSKVSVFYADKTAEKDFKIYIKEKTKIPITLIIIIVSIIILLFLVILNLKNLKKRRKR